MGRNTALSVLFLIVMGGTGFALPDWVDAYDFYGAPSSGSLGATADAAIHNVSGPFGTIPKGGFGPPAAAFKDQNGVFSVDQPHPALQFNDRWLSDYASGSHHPHPHHKRRSAHSPELSGRLWGRAAVIGVQRMFGHKRKDAIRQRAKLMGRMVMLLTDGLCTKSYDQFVERYSNPGDGPDEIARNARISRFEMRFSPTCWYEATASLAENAQPWILIEGGGDDCGVFISVQIPADANVPSRPVVDLQVPRDAKKGHDAGAMVRALQDIPSWRAVTAI